MPLLLQKPNGLGDKEPMFHLLANIHHYATEKGNLYVKGKTHIIWTDPAIQSEKTLKMARLWVKKTSVGVLCTPFLVEETKRQG